jgi:hypothetical protein
MNVFLELDEIVDVIDDELYPQEVCDCGERKRIQDLMCNKCCKMTIDTFREVMKKNFDKEQVEYLDSILDGEWITDFVFGKE